MVKISSDSGSVKWADDTPGQLLHAAGLYLGVVALLWCFPGRLNHRVPETDQAVVLTLVDAAAAELHNLAEPRISLDNNKGSKSVVGNLTLTLSGSTRLVDPTQMPSPSRLPVLAHLEPDERVEISDNQTTEYEPREEDALAGTILPEVNDVEVVVVRADQSGGSMDAPSSGVIVGEESVDSGELLLNTEGVEASSAGLPGNEARVSLAGGTAEDPGVILDVLVTTPGTDPHEDIPSFSEWAQKRLEEAEKKKTHPNASAQNPGGPGGRGTGSTKVRSKNYASPDCGSKIVAANPEAGSASSVLSSLRDEYMLNTCTSRVWFVVELCEAIQAEKIELANFELFSSSPKDFSVYVGDRFPSRDWSAVGHFTAKDERDIQSFALHPRLFGKFVKVELHSHYGSEHFCPVSLFRVFGTSEFEVLETENQIQESLENDDEDEDEGEELLYTDTGDPPPNLFGSARDAVLSIVKKAAEVLVKSGDRVNNVTKIRDDVENTTLRNPLMAACVTPRYTILCADCNETVFADVFRLVSCHDHYLDSLLKVNFIKETLSRTSMCPSLGVVTRATRELGDAEVTRNIPGARFLSATFPTQYIIALCNILAAKESRVIVNASYYVTGNNSEEVASLEDALITPPQGVLTGHEASVSSINSQAPHCPSDSNSQLCKSGNEYSTLTPNDVVPSFESLETVVKPPKTPTDNDGSKGEQPSAPLIAPSCRFTEESTFFETSTADSPSPNHDATNVFDKVADNLGVKGTDSETATHTVTVPLPMDGNLDIAETTGDLDYAGTTMPGGEAEVEVEKDQEGKISPQDQLSFDTLLSDLKDLDVESVTLQSNPTASSATLSQPAPSPQQKESVFLRLSNRIKTLERNMSLSGQYLEELSKRYKKQVEEMQRSLERAITAMNEESRRGEEREIRRLEEIVDLKEQVLTLSSSLHTLSNERESWGSKFSLIGQHLILVCVEIVIVLTVVSYCRRNVDPDDDAAESTEETRVSRRKSVGSSNGCVVTKKSKVRRPSEIASHIRGTYRELLIDESATTSDVVRKERKRKRKSDSIAKVPSVTISKFPTIKPLRRESLHVVPGGTNFPSRRASSSDAPSKYSDKDLGAPDSRYRPDSAPETSSGWFSDQQQSDRTNNSVNKSFPMPPYVPTDSVGTSQPIRGIEDITESMSSSEAVTGVKSKAAIDRSISPSKGSAEKLLKNSNLSTYASIKTALASRAKRSSLNNSNVSEVPSSISQSDNWGWNSEHSTNRSSQEDEESPTVSMIIPTDFPKRLNGISHTNGGGEESVDARSRSTTPTSGSGKEKRTYGLKKMVKKLF
ncbi:SUN domain-containing ossification factor isoform X2 [Athalia rosae]|uniref:SUN domain-containing ossification factor isoform X2 n=1 Tax=Athalia rosae TaxID=37344 RepID=UPI0020333A96|nr:SUN domain-containing ossification factor isoform X2 [Athalia rosae]